jgi:hypothetical protein
LGLQIGRLIRKSVKKHLFFENGFVTFIFLVPMSIIFRTIPIFLLLFFISCEESDKVDNGTKVVHFAGTKIVRQTIEYKNGLKNGYFKDYYKNGQLKGQQFFVNDTINDTSFLYHENGKLRSLQIFKDKVKSGCWKEFNKEGVMYSEIFFKNGVFDSTCSEYSYRSKQLLVRIRYKDGVKAGLEEHYYLNGNPKCKMYFKSGRVLKGTKEWNENGKEIDNDFKIFVRESDKVLMQGTLTYFITLENQTPDDEVYELVNPGKGNEIGDISRIRKKENVFIYEYTVPKGGFVMEKVTLSVFKKTKMGHTVVKEQSFNVASNNF